MEDANLGPHRFEFNDPETQAILDFLEAQRLLRANRVLSELPAELQDLSLYDLDAYLRQTGEQKS